MRISAQIAALAVTDPDGKQTAYVRSDGRITQLTDALGHSSQFNYGPVGVVSSSTPEGRTESASAHGTRTRYVLAASQDTVVGLTDPSGAMLGSFAYDPWGQRTATGEDLGYGYTGERQDPATGLVFLRARWYSPALGRFLTRDHADFHNDDPRTLHRYLYVSGDPLNHHDPSGLEIEEQEEEMAEEEEMDASDAPIGYWRSWSTPP